MILLEQAIKLYYEAYPTRLIDNALDVGDEWVFSACDRETGLEIDASPIAVNKDSGALRVFFPPNNVHKLAGAKHIPLTELENK